jgi:2-dehydropantoate 2-reductase
MEIPAGSDPLTNPHQSSAGGTIIVGTGAMACLFAARFSAAGIPFSMLGTWQEGLLALVQDGVRLVEADGSELVYPVQATNQPRYCSGARYALVLVKSWQTARAARQLAECLAPDGVALTLQNGLGNREVLAEILGSPRVALGVTTVGANLLGPGRVSPAGQGVTTLSAHPRLTPLADLLRASGLIVESAPDANALLWGKLVINAAINPLTALLGVPNGELLARREARALMAAVAREAASVAVAQGIGLPYPDPVVATETIARRTATNRSSMLQDVLRGAPTEIDAINGAIVRAGAQMGVPTPINRTLWQLLKALTSKGAGVRKP